MKGVQFMKENKKEVNEKMTREEYLYHNTEKLLKKYRDVVWSIEVAAIQNQVSLELDMDCNLDEYLEMSYASGADLSGIRIQEQMRVMERNKKMLKMIDRAVDILRRRHVDGEIYYWILYYTYFSERPCRNTEEIIELISEKTECMSWGSYFKRKTKAIEVLSSILWGFTTKECLAILNEFV